MSSISSVSSSSASSSSSSSAPIHVSTAPSNEGKQGSDPSPVGLKQGIMYSPHHYLTRAPAPRIGIIDARGYLPQVVFAEDGVGRTHQCQIHNGQRYGKKAEEYQKSLQQELDAVLNTFLIQELINICFDYWFVPPPGVILTTGASQEKAVSEEEEGQKAKVRGTLFMERFPVDQCFPATQLLPEHALERGIYLLQLDVEQVEVSISAFEKYGDFIRWGCAVRGDTQDAAPSYLEMPTKTRSFLEPLLNEKKKHYTFSRALVNAGVWQSITIVCGEIERDSENRPRNAETDQHWRAFTIVCVPYPCSPNRMQDIYEAAVVRAPSHITARLLQSSLEEEIE